MHCDPADPSLISAVTHTSLQEEHLVRIAFVLQNNLMFCPHSELWNREYMTLKCD